MSGSMLRQENSSARNRIDMYKYLLIMILSLASLDGASRVEIDWQRDCFRAKETKEGVVIEYDAKIQAGRKLVLTGVESYTGSGEAVLWYQTVHSIPESYRSLESVTIHWEISREDYLKWKAERKFVLKKKDEIHLTEAQIREIKELWK